MSNTKFNKAGQDYWDAMTGKYGFTISEEILLTRICIELDLIDRMDIEVADSDFITKGSMGQDVANPLLGEISKHTGLINTLIKSLHLPEEAAATTVRKRAAVNARWNVA